MEILILSEINQNRKVNGNLDFYQYLIKTGRLMEILILSVFNQNRPVKGNLDFISI